MTNFFSKFKQNNMLNKLIYVNLAVFVLVKLVDIMLMLSGIKVENPLVDWFMVYAGWHNFITHPWGIITYMFLHQEFMHILFNLLWLFWFGQIFLEYFSNRQLLNVYLCGGIAGALLFILCYNVFPTFNATYACALGASAAVYAVVLAVAAYVPNYTVFVLFLGQIRIKWIAIFSVISDIALLKSGNAGGHIAHIGGALFGMWYIIYLKRGTDITAWLGRIIDWLVTHFNFQRKPKMKVTYKRRGETDYEYNKRRYDNQKEIDAILDKIAKSGYDGLTDDEKRKLFTNSRNV